MFYINSAINPILYNTMSSRSLSSSSSLSSLGHSRPSAGMALLDLRVVTSPGEYEGNCNVAELHFECFFQGYPTCLRRTLRSKVMAENCFLGNRPLYFGRLSSTENKVTKNKYTSYSPTRFRERFRRVFGCGKKKPLVRLVKEGQHGLFSFMFKSCSGKRKQIQARRRQICVCHQYKPYWLHSVIRNSNDT